MFLQSFLIISLKIEEDLAPEVMLLVGNFVFLCIVQSIFVDRYYTVFPGLWNLVGCESSLDQKV